MSNEIEKYKLRYDATTNYLMHRVTDFDDFKLLAVTITFNSKGAKEAEDKWLSYYKKDVLNKFRRRLASGKLKQQGVLPIDDIAQYELDISSKLTCKKTLVHHIHALLPIYTKYWDKIVNEDNTINSRLIKDINSMHFVSSALIEPLDKSAAYTWLSYMTKGKHKSNFSWNK